MKQNAAKSSSIKDLLNMIQQGVAPEYVFFWREIPKEPGCIDESCLSNWFPAMFQLEDITYLTTEHYMMAEKAKLFSDWEIRDEIISADSPKQAKALGRRVRGFNQDLWAEHRFEIVVKGNYAKFKQNKNLGQFLLETGTKVLVEASPYDRIWGIGMSKDDYRAQNPQRWNGLNLLGFALMEVRSRLA